MIRGGDTPKQETLWAIEFESGKFAFGHANENEIVVATIPLGRKIWYTDESGVIAGTTESVDEVVNTIIDTFNEHFGTDISHLTTETVLFNVGDKVYNWDAYEIIPQIETRYLAIERGTASPSVWCTILRGKHLRFLCSKEETPNTILVTYPDGLVRSYSAGIISDGLFNNNIKILLTRAGIEVETYGTETLETTPPLNTEMPNWENFQYVSNK